MQYIWTLLIIIPSPPKHIYSIYGGKLFNRVPYGPQLGVAAEFAVFEELAGGWINDREVPLGEEGQWVLAACGGHRGDSL